MNNTESLLPIFPLPVFILPGGMTRLRIFEPRYLKMVTIAAKEQGFVIWLNNTEKALPKKQWGSWVNIINFDQGLDGVLEIDVKCHSLVELSRFKKDNANLNFAEARLMSHWSQNSKNNHALSKVNSLSKSLTDVFNNDSTLNEIYDEKLVDNNNWVVARWLELLPIDLTIKASFVLSHSYEKAENFVQSIVHKS
ncbi:LON peptidase substrate-binding domain-containing protein [Colwelliaceae bacterium 6441]